MQTAQLQTHWSLSRWQDHLNGLYGDVNEQRRPLETYARLTEMAAGTARGVREDNEQLMQKYMPRFLAWLLGLSSQLDVDVETVVFRYYPGVCTYCQSSRNCACGITNNSGERLVKESDISRLQSKHEKPSTLNEWVGMFNKIYGNINRSVGERDLLFHLLEELGEVCEMIRHYMIKDQDLEDWSDEINSENINVILSQEIADLFAWYCGIADVLGVQVDHRMKMTYEESCPVCYSNPCECSPYRIHSSRRL